MVYFKRQNLLLLIVLTFCATTFSQTKDSTTNTQKSNYYIPRPTGYVNDYESLFSNAQINYLDSLMSNFENKTAIQIVIVSIDTTMVSTDNFDDFTRHMLSAWGVGHKEKKTGILISISAGYRKMRIQNGYGIERILSDAQTKQIIDSFFIPRFIKGEIYNGTLNGLKAIMEKLN